MLDKFLEIGVATEDIARSFDALCSLGFRTIPVGDTHTHPYAAVSDGTVCIGLHDRGFSESWLTFVRPGLKAHVRALRRYSIGLEFVRLADDQFHEIGFRDPSGQLVVLCEARTFSPPATTAGLEPSVCGEFLEYSLASASLDDSCGFWQQLGLLVVAEGREPHPWARLAGGGMVLGLHECAPFRAGLSFSAIQLSARVDYLRAKGHAARARAPMAGSAGASATLLACAELPVYLVEPANQPA